jgi:aminoglycoside phosphotransferase family enzyme
MKKLLLTIAIVFSGIVYMQAQEVSAADKKAAAVTNEIKTACNLTSTQADKIAPFIKTFMENKFALNQKYSNDANALQAANKTNKAQLQANLKTVLSEEQMTQVKNYFAKKNNSVTYPPTTSGGK